MAKRTRKARAAKAARKSRGKMGGARPGSGPKPKLGAGVIRDVIKTVRLSGAEHEAQLAAVKRSGAKDWAHWARGLLNLQAEESARAAAVVTYSAQLPPIPPVVDLHPDVAAGMAPVELPRRGAVVVSTDPCVCGHAPEEHGHDPAFPGSTACGADLGAEGCDCPAYEADPEAENDSLAERQSSGPA
jgi:hypothetical protein